MNSSPVAYQIDALDRLIEVNQAWTEFARANNGLEVLPEFVLGKSLWNFITDVTVEEIYRRLAKLAREGRDTQFRYRCDSPKQKRIFQMRILGRPGGKVEFTSTLLSAEDRPAIPLLKARSEFSGIYVRICGWCHAVAWPGESWRPLEMAAERVIGLEETELPELSHGICEACAAGMMVMMKPPPVAS